MQNKELTLSATLSDNCSKYFTYFSLLYFPNIYYNTCYNTEKMLGENTPEY